MFFGSIFTEEKHKCFSSQKMEMFPNSVSPSSITQKQTHNDAFFEEESFDYNRNDSEDLPPKIVFCIGCYGNEEAILCEKTQPPLQYETQLKRFNKLAKRRKKNLK